MPSAGVPKLNGIAVVAMPQRSSRAETPRPCRQLH